jgi:hypothetical protein
VLSIQWPGKEVHLKAADFVIVIDELALLGRAWTKCLMNNSTSVNHTYLETLRYARIAISIETKQQGEGITKPRRAWQFGALPTF